MEHSGVDPATMGKIMELAGEAGWLVATSFIYRPEL